MFKRILAAVGLAIMLAGCDGYAGSSDDIQNQHQEQMNRQAIEVVGMPAITHFWEKKLLKDVMELRDKGLPTITYLPDLNGHVHKVCDSFGYGIPYSTQYTNPVKQIDNGYHDSPTIAQADPNGLYSPASADGTWVLCLNPSTKKASVLYLEPRIIVSPYPLNF
jgi:hypothetical protein